MVDIRPQYHFRRTPDGLDAYDVKKLIRLSAALPIIKINPHDIAELDQNHWYFSGGDPTPRSIIEHLQLIQACDLSYPIILDAQGRLMDGMHRVCKAVMADERQILAVRFTTDPPPDYVNCRPEDLPYD
ncbi:MAG: hypothetical protein ACFHXK_05940 [bacterium]